MQQPNEMMSPPALPWNLTTEQIQKYLEENQQLIMVIMENQNLGKAAECALYQRQLQNNLMYLAKIADNQPQPPKAPSQTLSQPSMQEEHYMQPSQAAMSQQQQGFIFPMSPDQQQQLSYVQQQQLIQAQMGMTPTGNYQSRPGTKGSRQDGSEGGASDGLGSQSKANLKGVALATATAMGRGVASRRLTTAIEVRGDSERQLSSLPFSLCSDSEAVRHDSKGSDGDRQQQHHRLEATDDNLSLSSLLSLFIFYF
ncbi:hypothetical protein LWI28_026975 [Acer negundo]|uniref:SS18 N-terminal domain-containing protein n=1 Tax=Acer negundo TaxID=4023 RepID=A0AAD5NHK1_ACENE|nr:hypothetical protein LWI28_026975 [Acer negundo]